MPTANTVIRKKVAFTPGLTVLDVLNQTKLTKDYPEISQCTLGIFSIPASLETSVHPGDRIEIYRPLLIDPKEKRRQRVK